MEAKTQFSPREAARILQATEARVRNWARLGGVVPQAGAFGRPTYTFQQLLLLRTTKSLCEAGIPARRVRRVWSSLRRQLAADLPLTSIRILADGDRAVAWDGDAPWQPDSGQFLLDFDVAAFAEQAASESPAALALCPAPPNTTPRPIEIPRRERAALTADQWFHLGCELEETSPLEARQAYRHALEADPGYADAHTNLGRLDHEAGDLDAAEDHYRSAVRHAPEDATCRYNLAVLLQDRNRPEDAIESYREAIARDPEAADAHYNLGLLLESRDRSEAFRHLMTARRLYAP